MTGRATIMGAAAGTIAALAFTMVHGMMISGIWFMLLPMVIAGALCGLLLGASYVLLVDSPSVGGWLRYNALYLLLLFMLGPISLLLFEPMMTIPELLASPNGMPAELLREITPLATIYTVIMALIITYINGRRWSGFLVALAATAVLMFLLGLNIAPLGLVYLSGGWLRMLLELLALILTLNFVYVLAFVLLGHGWLWNARSSLIST
jgi:hypothetical protein